MSANIKVAATGIVALCLVLSVVLYLSSFTNPSMYETGEKFFGLAVTLIIAILVLSIFGVRVKFP